MNQEITILGIIRNNFSCEICLQQLRLSVWLNMYLYTIIITQKYACISAQITKNSTYEHILIVIA